MESSVAIDMDDSPRSSKRRRLNPPSTAPTTPRSSRRLTKKHVEANGDLENVLNTPARSARESRVMPKISRKQAKTTEPKPASQRTAETNDGDRDELALSPRSEADELDADPEVSVATTKSPSRKRNGVNETSIAASEKSQRATAKTPKHKPNRVSTSMKAQPNGCADAMDVDEGDEMEMTLTNGQSATSSVAEADQFSLLKSIVLAKLSQRRPIKLQNLANEYTKVHQLVHATVTAGESNSLLLIGARGSGKTAMVNAALKDLSMSQKEHFHIIRLNGFIQTDDKLALKEIWRQLGREMEISDDEDGAGKSYADTLTMLLALLSHPDEITGASSNNSSVAKSVIFIMDEFDLFATHARQTLLYNLLDIAQSRKAPIAVIGLTTRIDVTEALEKRVKSRFSHRYVHLGLPKTLSAFIDVGKAALRVEKDELSFEASTKLLGSNDHVKTATAQQKQPKQGHAHADLLADWNSAIETLFSSPAFLKSNVHPIYYTTKSIPALLSSLIVPVSRLTTTTPTVKDFQTSLGLLTPPDSSLHILPSLSELALSLLIAACRLSIIHSTDTTNFPLAYAEYVSLASKARINSAASGALAAGAGTRVFGKEAARREWEKLLGYGLFVPVASGAFGLGMVASGVASKNLEMVRVDVALEEIPLSVEMSAVMEKWCLQI